jgi:hypothetical protein
MPKYYWELGEEEKTGGAGGAAGPGVTDHVAVADAGASSVVGVVLELVLRMDVALAAGSLLTPLVRAPIIAIRFPTASAVAL